MGKHVLDNAIALDVEQRLGQRGLPARKIGLGRPYAAQLLADLAKLT
jgi:hypothetical protein